MTILDSAMAHFKAAQAQLKTVAVPEWSNDDVPGVIYYKPVMSLLEKGHILKAYQSDNPASALAEVLIIRALDEHGNALFKKAHKAMLLRDVDENVIARIVNEMQAESDELTLEDAEKNS